MTVPRGLPFRTVDPQALADDPRPERTVARDLVRHGLLLGPLLILGWAAPISLPLLMGAVLGGYVLRLGLIFLAVFLVRDASWFEKLPLGLTIIVTHLVLLIWELRYVSASLAYPGLKPSSTAPTP